MVNKMTKPDVKAEMERRKSQDRTCGTCKFYWKDIKRCSVWGRKRITDPILTFEPEDGCRLMFCGWRKGEPRNFRRIK